MFKRKHCILLFCVGFDVPNYYHFKKLCKFPKIAQFFFFCFSFPIFALGEYQLLILYNCTIEPLQFTPLPAQGKTTYFDTFFCSNEPCGCLRKIFQESWLSYSLWWPIYYTNSVDNIKLSVYTLPPTQHHSFSRNEPSPFIEFVAVLCF